MSDERLARMEDMMGQLVGMVGKMAGDVSTLKSDVSTLKEEVTVIKTRLGSIESQNEKFQETLSYLMTKSTQHDHDIHILQQRLIKTI